MRRLLPSPALVVAVVALLLALAGTGVAQREQVRLSPDSVGRSAIREGAVGSAQVRDRSLQAKDVRPGALTGAQVADRSIAARDLARGVIPSGVRLSTVRASGDEVRPGQVGSVSAQCPAGRLAIGGGGGFAGPPTTKDALAESIPVADDGDGPVRRWRVSLVNGGESARTPVAYVRCLLPES